MAHYRNAKEALFHAYNMHWQGESLPAQKLLEVVIEHVVPKEKVYVQAKEQAHQGAKQQESGHV